MLLRLKLAAELTSRRGRSDTSRLGLQGKKRAITYFNLFVKDRVAEITAEFEERRLQQEADVKAGKLAGKTLYAAA